MTLALRYAASSDPGLVRDNNEDSAFAGPRLLVVADGMGGHAAGEVASAVAVASLAHLDEDLPGSDLLAELREAVLDANLSLKDMVASDPALDGMGTTLTALLHAGSRLGMAHVGDSRCYLLRGGELAQVTHDHTFVQRLVDEGQISAEEAETHPQRSLLLRALDGRDDVEPDLSVRELKAGDRWLLCTDGLSGVVREATLAEILAASDTPRQAAQRLVELAIKGGGPDNITVIVAYAVDDDGDDDPQVVGAASEAPLVERVTAGSPAARAALLAPRRKAAGGTPKGPGAGLVRATPTLGPGEDADPTRGGPVGQVVAGGAVRGHAHRGRGWVKALLGLAVVVALLAVVAVGGYAWWSRQYFVGATGSEVAVFRGVSGTVAGLHLSSVHDRLGVPLTQLPGYEQRRVEAGIDADSLPDARRIAARLRQEVLPTAQTSDLPVAVPSVRSSAVPTGSAGVPPTSARPPVASPTVTR